MKRLLYTGIILTAVMASCRKEPLLTYTAEDNIYFNYMDGSRTFLDSLNFTFAYSEDDVTDTFIKLPVAVTGAPSSTDRHFNVTIDPVSTAIQGTNYDLPEFVIHAGKVNDTLLIHLKRSPDLATSKKYLVFNLHPNEFFKTNILFKIGNGVNMDTCHLLTFSLSVSDILSAGPYWNTYYSSYFGAFSVKKVRLLHDMLGMPLDFWSVKELDNARITSAIYYASTMGRYLLDQAAQGNTIYDEDDVTPMRMGAAYQ